ncbi:MAG: hypothetical protein KGK33_06900 [Hyphomicrobiales bacterium]|nr:hypothetical protein [Hyphomicrobiales bacterium]
MSSTAMLHMPDRDALKALYDGVIAEINQSRNDDQLTTDFYRKTSEALFDASYLALSDALTNTRRVYTMASPAGSGKSSFAYAFAVALVRYAETDPNCAQGVVFLVNERMKAQETYYELYGLAPGKVAIWTSDHDLNAASDKADRKVTEPAAYFLKQELRDFPIAVVTQNFYLLPNNGGLFARTYSHNGHIGARALTFVDERPKETKTLEVTLDQAEKARATLIEKYPATTDHINTLLRFMQHFSYEATPNSIHRPRIEINQSQLTELNWFITDEATKIAKVADNILIASLFAFAKAFVIGRGCIFLNGPLAYFFGYDGELIINRTAGTVLLDATADLDGVANIVPWRVHVDTPIADYKNLEVIHVPKQTTKPLNKYLDDAPNARAYVRWMLDVIEQHMAPGELGLVVCKEKLLKSQRIPAWPEGDPRFSNREAFTDDYAWDVGGRHLCVSHYGTGIGKNAWRDASVIFLFDEFWPPRRVAIGTTQSYREHQAHEGDLGRMRSMRSRAQGVDSIYTGEVLRWMKQLALRGNARNYDANGVCGKQRVVIACDWKLLLSNHQRMFPGAKLRSLGDASQSSVATKILDYLNSTDATKILCADLTPIIGKPWRKISSNVLTEAFLESIGELGFRYVKVNGKPKKGKLGTRFERLTVVPKVLPGFPLVTNLGAAPTGAAIGA